METDRLYKSEFFFDHFRIHNGENFLKPRKIFLMAKRHVSRAAVSSKIIDPGGIAAA